VTHSFEYQHDREQDIMIWKLAIGGLIAVSVAWASLSLAPRETRAPASDSPAPVIADRGSAHRGGIPADDTELQALSGLLEREVEERLRLQQQVDELQARLDRLDVTGDGLSTGSPDLSSSDPDRETGRPSATGGVSEAALTAAGFSSSEAAYFRRLHDQAAMARLYLRDQAEREGWMGTPRYFESLQEIRTDLQSVRDSMDDETLSRYLYALGQPNQVTVQRVLTGSAAANAGLEPGDVLISYEGSRVFAVSDVRRATRSGQAGDTVTIEVLRDGQRIQAYLPRGPLGVTMNSASVLPGEES
jgi:hypothetical protein